MTLFTGVTFASLLLFPVFAHGARIVRYPIPETPGDKRYQYPRELLEAALSKIHKDYRIEDATIIMNQERQVTELIAGRFVDVAPIATSAERETLLRQIRIPLNKGLLGWRIGLIRKGEQAQFSKIKTLEDLKKLRIGQGSQWPDVGILKANGIDVVAGPTYPGLFAMLASGRFDYFPRAVTEIWAELSLHADTLEIEQSFAMHYVFYDSYFFVGKNNPELAEDIDQGLEQIIADGTFDKLFEKYWGDNVRKARLNERTIIELRNPQLTPETPSGRRELWYFPKPDR